MNIEWARRIMVLAPHPDDEVLGCGGSLAWHSHFGAKISVIYMTSGEAGGGSLSDYEMISRIREQEGSAGASILGIDDLHYLRLRDGNLQYNWANVNQLAILIRQLRPEIIYAPHDNDAHPDHKCCHNLTVSAIDQAARLYMPLNAGRPWKVHLMLGYEVFSPLSKYNHVQDITSFIELKRSALKCHQSQLQIIPYDEAIVGLNLYRGITSAMGSFCECFFQYLT